MPDESTSLAASPVNISGSLHALPRDASPLCDISATARDVEAGKRLAYEMGDTFIDFHHDTARDQWTCIAGALRLHGFKITFPDDDHECLNCGGNPEKFLESKGIACPTCS